MKAPLWTITGALSLLLLAALSVMATALSRDRPDLAHPETRRHAPRGPFVKAFMVLGTVSAAMVLLTAVLALFAKAG
jgi:hypothetical protein